MQSRVLLTASPYSHVTFCFLSFLLFSPYVCSKVTPLFNQKNPQFFHRIVVSGIRSDVIDEDLIHRAAPRYSSSVCVCRVAAVQYHTRNNKRAAWLMAAAGNRPIHGRRNRTHKTCHNHSQGIYTHKTGRSPCLCLHKPSPQAMRPRHAHSSVLTRVLSLPPKKIPKNK